jgi:hypothetical protein
MVPDDLWEWAQQESGMVNPGPWLREQLYRDRVRAEEPPLFNVTSAQPEQAEVVAEPRDWEHWTAPRTVGRFYRDARYPTTCCDCGVRIPGGHPLYLSVTRTGIEQERCWPCGEVYKNFWWPNVDAPHRRRRGRGQPPPDMTPEQRGPHLGES